MNSIKTKIIGLLLVITGISAGYAQMVTPFTPASRDENGKRIYVNPQENYRRTSLSAGYGYGSIPMPRRGVFSGVGIFSLSIGHEITPWLELEFPIMLGFAKNEYVGSKDSWYMFMPGMRINWMRNNWLALYSKASIGMALHTCDQLFGGSMANDRGVVPWQLSPIGCEIGKGWLNLFVEGGYGYRGFLVVGLKFKLGSGNASRLDWIVYPPM